jgi:hypothetical protein
VSSPNDPEPPAEPSGPTPPRTQEIPVAAPAAPAPQLPPHPGATSPAPVQTVQTTGPVTFVPGPPGPPPPLSPASAHAGAFAAGTTTPPPPPPPDHGAPAAWPDSLVTGPVPMAEEAEEPPRRQPARDRSSLLALGLVVASLALLQLGLGLRFGGESFWSDIPLWSAFATACTVLGLAASASLLPAARRLGPGAAWRVAAGGLVGLAAFWVLVVLPVVASDRGFLLTAALGCLGAALWTGPARRT